MVLLHPGGQVEEAGQQQVDEGHHHRQSQQTGLVQLRVRDRCASAPLLDFLFGTVVKELQPVKLQLHSETVVTSTERTAGALYKSFGFPPLKWFLYIITYRYRYIVDILGHRLIHKGLAVSYFPG